MNKARRKQISDAIFLLNQARELLEPTAADERQALEALPEGFQAGDRGEAMNRAADGLDEEVTELEMMADRLTEIRDGSL